MATDVNPSIAVKSVAATTPAGTVTVIASVAAVPRVNNSETVSVLTISAVITPLVSALILFI